MVIYWLNDKVIICKSDEIRNNEFMVLIEWIVLEENVKIY